MLDVQIAPYPALRRLLERHPRVASVSESGGAPLRWVQDGHWHRRIWVGRSDIELKGLVELMDNNPLVCADEMSVPSAAGTLALIALGPLARAGLILEPPTHQLSFEAAEEEVDDWLTTTGWKGGVTLSISPLDTGEVVSSVTIAALASPPAWSDIDDLYGEAFGRSFNVRRNEGSEWDTHIVAGTAHAAYRLRLTPGDEQSLVTIQVMADREGKCGAAQIVHAFNVMAGFEESLGL